MAKELSILFLVDSGVVRWVLSFFALGAHGLNVSETDVTLGRVCGGRKGFV